MHTRRLVAAVAVVATAVIAATVATGTGTPAGAATVPSGAAHVRLRGHCLLPVPRAGVPVGTRVGESSGPAPATAAPAPPAGNLVVTIPPVTLIREVGRSGSRHLWITTNTGVLPQPQDGFWVLGSRRAQPADAVLRAEVLAGCTSWAHI